MAQHTKIGNRYVVVESLKQGVAHLAGTHETEEAAAQHAANLDGLERTLSDGKTKVSRAAPAAAAKAKSSKAIELADNGK